MSSPFGDFTFDHFAGSEFGEMMAGSDSDPAKYTVSHAASATIHQPAPQLQTLGAAPWDSAGQLAGPTRATGIWVPPTAPHLQVATGGIAAEHGTTHATDHSRLDLSSTVLSNDSLTLTSASINASEPFKTLLATEPQVTPLSRPILPPSGIDFRHYPPLTPPGTEIRLPAACPAAGPSPHAVPSGSVDPYAAPENPESWSKLCGIKNESAASQQQIYTVAATAPVTPPARSAAWLRENRYPWIEDVSILERAIDGLAEPEDLGWLLDIRYSPSTFERPKFPPKRRDARRHFAKVYSRFEVEFLSAWREYEMIVRYGGKFEEDVVRRAFGARWRAHRRRKARGYLTGDIFREHYSWLKEGSLFAEKGSDIETDTEEDNNAEVSEAK